MTDKIQEQVLSLFPEYLRFRWKKAAQAAKGLQEIRLRAKRPVILLLDGKEWFMEESGGLTMDAERARRLPEEELEAVLNRQEAPGIEAFCLNGMGLSDYEQSLVVEWYRAE